MDENLSVSLWIWGAFNAGVLVLLALDLGLLQRKAHAPTLREASVMSGVWVALSLLFCAGIFVFGGGDPGIAFLTGYVIEYSLSVDNIFVFVLLFSYFAVPAQYHHRVLFWGVIGALVMRGVMIALGAALLHEFHWVIYVFGGLLVASGIRMAFQHKESVDMETNFAVRLLRKLMPISPDYDGQRFLVRRNGVLMATPLLLVLLVVESTDLIFAIDSIPAIFAVTRDPFIVYTSNVCAILGLRSLYFVLAGVVGKFHYLTPGLALVLVWVGAKMLLTDVYHVPIPLSLGVIISILATAVVASLVFPPKSPIHAEDIASVQETLHEAETVH